MTPLHDVEALVSLAEGPPGPAQSWAASRLAIVAPERFAWWPSDDVVHDVVVMAAPPKLTLLADHLGTEHAAVTASMAVGCGAIGSESAPALRAALSGRGRPADLWLAEALSA